MKAGHDIVAEFLPTLITQFELLLVISLGNGGERRPVGLGWLASIFDRREETGYHAVAFTLSEPLVSAQVFVSSRLPTMARSSDGTVTRTL